MHSVMFGSVVLFLLLGNLGLGWVEQCPTILYIMNCTHLLHFTTPMLSCREKEPYEWYLSYHSIRQLLTPTLLSASQGLDPAHPRRILEISVLPQLNTAPSIIQPSRARARVLVVGCGNSQLSEDMLRDGWTGGITNIDFSNVVINQMKSKVSYGCSFG